ncbi:MAG: Tol-Pal system beta propeller repeat protein TolB [Gammaproteobacteria bacterium]|nr:Tol-Pal system beta propeller repeat protein TolB [Gammaproteobacteria bacterium]
MGWPVAHAALTIEITEGVADKLPIAVVPFATEGADALVGSDLSAVVIADLQRSGRFKALPLTDLVARPSDPSKVNFQDWRMLGQDNLLIGSVKAAPQGYEVRFFLFDVLKGQQIKAFSLPAQPTTLRATAHKISDMVYEALIGEPGAFSTRIAYVTVQHKAGASSVHTLWIADADGYGARDVLNSPTEIMSPAWSPDGTKLAYSRFEHDHFVLYVQEIATGTRGVVADALGHNGAPAWSPDGTKLALAMQHKRHPGDAGNFDIYILDLRSKALTRFTDHWAVETHPAWSPDGNSLVFTSDRSGRPQIYRKALAGGKEERLTFEGVENDRASFSPNGKMLAMIHANSGEYRVAVLDLETSQLRVLTDSSLDESPSFAPNGSMIIYATTFKNAKILAKQRLSQEGRVLDPAWSPLLRTSQ